MLKSILEKGMRFRQVVRPFRPINMTISKLENLQIPDTNHHILALPSPMKIILSPEPVNRIQSYGSSSKLSGIRRYVLNIPNLLMIPNQLGIIINEMEYITIDLEDINGTLSKI